MLDCFHPLTQRWFRERFQAPTEPQVQGWPAIARRRDTLIAAPTGSGKTLAAFLYSIDRLLRAALAGQLEERTHVLYVSPLRALSNDIQSNLQAPLAELLELARQANPDCPDIRALVRTGDTPQSERQRMLRQPPHILVTTPESFYLVLTGQRSREILRGVDTVIVDEIHALARDKRGSHLTLSLERLDALARGARPVRIGLSATQKPMTEIARFLAGTRADADPPTIIDTGHARKIDLAVEIPERPLEAICSHEHWGEIYEKLVGLINTHRSTLVFVNTRRLAERVARQLSQRLGEDAVSSHHGSLSHRIRQRTEQRLKAGELKAVVATASLELGIDVGHIDLVCQIGSPRSIATMLQRIGRAGHSLGLVPKGRLVALTRDELVECLALVRAVYSGRLDRVQIPQAPLDILAQQLVAIVANDEFDEEELYALCRRAHPYRDLPRKDYEEILEMLSEGVSPRLGRKGAYLHRDRVGKKLRSRRGARITAVTCGGAIPEIADYRVVTDEDPPVTVGSVHEDFAIESLAGDIFLLGNTSWRIKQVKSSEVVVQDARGAPPTIPFWLGEAPGRTFELSSAVSDLRRDLSARMPEQAAAFESDGNFPGREDTLAWLMAESHATRAAAEQVINYVAAQKAATGLVPTQDTILFERFFDESGGMQLVVHAPFGTRITRGWGLAMRKRFCRSFNFELQASASDDGIVLSLGPQHSFPLEQMYGLVPSHLVRDVLIQALLAVPFFTTRWRWNATRALAIKRHQGGGRVPPPLQRFRADDLLSAIFPMATACLEHITGDIELPDHPLVRQTVTDCLTEACDIDGILQVLGDLEAGAVKPVGIDTREPSPFSHELLNANPYAFLDDAPLEERRARAVSLRRTLPIDALRELGRLDPDAIAQVRAEAWPLVRDPDELHDALLSLGVLPAAEGREWADFFKQLQATRRAGGVSPTVTWRAGGVSPLDQSACNGATHTSGTESSVQANGHTEPVLMLVQGANAPRSPGREEFWVASERWPILQAIWPAAVAEPQLDVPAGVRRDWSREDAVIELVRGRMEIAGPIAETTLVETLCLPLEDVQRALLALEVQGSVLRGNFLEGASKEQTDWCERRLLARIHRLTLDGLRRQIEPVEPERFVQFLVRHQHRQPTTKLRGQAGLLEVIEQLQGFEAPAGDWERFLLPSRLESYDPGWLDMLCLSGQVVWGRLRPTPRSEEKARPMRAMTRSIPVTLMLRRDLPWLTADDHEEKRGRESFSPGSPDDAKKTPDPFLSGTAREALAIFQRHGALFAPQLIAFLKTVPSLAEDALAELAAAGLITCDGFAGLRQLIASRQEREGRQPRGRRASAEVGRWSLLRDLPPLFAQAEKIDEAVRVEHWCKLLLTRYGVMFRDLLSREPAAPAWQDLVRCYRRLEAGGAVRGGRFVARVAGEQYGLPEVVDRLRQLEQPKDDERKLVLTATDPLNLSGRVGPGPKVPATAGTRIVLDRGQLFAMRKGANVQFFREPATSDERAAIEYALRVARNVPRLHDQPSK